MIRDRIENIKQYDGVVPAEMIADFLEKNDAKTIPCGRYELDGGAFVNVCDITESEDCGKYEAHRKFSDLQYVVTGDEVMFRTDVRNCFGGEYSDGGDCIIFDDCDGTFDRCHLTAGEFALFDPVDAHMPGLRGKARSIRKLIFKLPVE